MKRTTKKRTGRRYGERKRYRKEGGGRSSREGWGRTQSLDKLGVGRHGEKPSTPEEKEESEVQIPPQPHESSKPEIIFLKK